MRGALKIFIIIFFICNVSNSFSQVDPTIPIPERNLQNTLTNPIIDNNPFIEQNLPKSTLPKEVPSNTPLPTNQPQQEIPPQQKPEKEEEAEKEKLEKEETAEKEKLDKSNDKKEAASDDSENGLFGPIRIGPMIGLGLLMEPIISIDSKFFRYIGFSINYAWVNGFDMFRIPKVKNFLNSQSDDYQFTSLSLNYSQLEGKVSIYPFGGNFYIGAAYGRRKFDINAKGNLNVSFSFAGFPLNIQTPFIEEINITSIYWTPQIGWLATWGGKLGWFAIGTELGVQLTLQTTVTSTTVFPDPDIQLFIPLVLQTPQYAALSNELNTTISNALKDYPLPYWNILKIGWIF
jgi:hypothetical protein